MLSLLNSLSTESNFLLLGEEIEKNLPPALAHPKEVSEPLLGSVIRKIHRRWRRRAMLKSVKLPEMLPPSAVVVASGSGDHACVHVASTLSNQVIVLLRKLLVKASSLSWILEGWACHVELVMAMGYAKALQPQSLILHNHG